MKDPAFLTFVSLAVLIGCSENEPTDGGLTSGIDSSLGEAGVVPDGSLGDGSVVDGTVSDTSVGEGGLLDAGDSSVADAAGDSTVADAGPQPQRLMCPIAVDDTECPVCDADATCDSPTYTDLGDGTVASSCCGLVWQQSIGSVQRNFYDAYDYCASLTLAGGGWRLPTVTELQTLVEGTEGPTIDETYFPGTPSFDFQTVNSTPSAGGHWVVTFYSGHTIEVYPENKVWVRCVR